MQRRQVLASLPLLGFTTAIDTVAAAETYTPISRFDLAGAKEAIPTSDGQAVALAVSNGFAIVDCTTPATPRIATENRSVLGDHPNGPLQAIWDIAIDDTHLAVAGPAHGPVDQRLAAVAVYDITDHTAPRRLLTHETSYPIHNCDINDGTIYLTGNNDADNPLVMVDLDTGEELGRWSIIDANTAWSDVPAALRTLHDVTVHGPVAVLAHWDAGTWLLDVSDPTSPTPIAHTQPIPFQHFRDIQDNETAIAEAHTQLPGNAHYATLSPDRAILGVGREAWDIHPANDHDGGPGGIDLYDTTQPTDLTHITHIPPPPTPDPSPSGVWTTAHNFELTSDRLFAAWYRGGITIHDITTPTNPTRLTWWRAPDTASFWTARLGNGWVAASSRRNPPNPDGQGAALYLFPDRAGTQPAPPPLTPTTTPTTTTTTTTATTTTTPTTTTPTTTPETTAPGQPGFGLLTAAIAIAYGAYRTLTND